MFPQITLSVKCIHIKMEHIMYTNKYCFSGGMVGLKACKQDAFSLYWL